MNNETPPPAAQDPTATPPPSPQATPATQDAAATEETPPRRGPGRPGGVGEKIFKQVENLVDNEGLSRTEAFQRISQESGRRSGTVAANYYRVARKREGRSPSGDTPRPGRPRRRRSGGDAQGSGGGDASAALAKAREALEELSTVVRAQEKELNRLREQTAQLDKFKKWMDKNVS